VSVKFTNNAETTLASGINSSVTSLTVASSSGFPTITTGEYFYVTLDDGTNNEIVKVTAVSGTTWTIVRAQDNTTARSFSSSNKVELRVTAGLITDAVADALASSFAKNAFTGDGTTTDFTLSQSPNSEDDLIVFIEGVFQNQSTYSLSGTTLTFSTAPANTRAIVVYTVKAAVSGANLNHDQFTASGSAAFTLSIAPINENNTQVFIDGVYQQKTDYAVSGTTLTFDTAPASGAIVEVMTFTQTEVNVPTADSVTTASIADNVGLGGSPTTTTQSASDNSTKIATTAYVTTAVANIIDAAPDTLNTLNEIAAALNDDANFNTTVTNSIASKMPLAGGTFTGDVTFNGTNLYFNGAASSANYNLALENSDTFTSFYGATDATVSKGYKFYTGNQSADLALTLDATGKLSVGGATPQGNLTIKGAASDDIDLLTFSEDGTNQSFSFNGNFAGSGSTGNNLTLDSYWTNDIITFGGDGKVGIGTASPAYLLQLQASTDTDLSIISGTSSGDFGSILFGDTDYPAEGRITYQNSDNKMRFWSDRQHVMTLDDNARVGIGTESPSDYWSTANALVVRESDNSTGITIVTGTSNTGQIYFADGTSGDARYRGWLNYAHGTDTMSLATAASTKVTILSSGNVGIGTDDPKGVLHVHGGDSGSSYTADGADKLIIEHSDSVAIDLRTPASNQAIIMFSDGTRSQGLIGYNHSNDSLRFSNSGNQTRMTINSDGSVTLGGALSLGDTITHGNGVLDLYDGGSNTSLTNGVTNGNVKIQSVVSGVGIAAVIRAGDSALGQVDLPYQSGFHANSPAVTNGGGNVIIFGGTHHNTGSDYSTTTGRYTAPRTGRYLISASVLMNPGSTTSYERILFGVNQNAASTQFGDTLCIPGNTNYEGLNITVVLTLGAGDYVQVYNMGESPTYGTSYGSFSGFYLG